MQPEVPVSIGKLTDQPTTFFLLLRRPKRKSNSSMVLILFVSLSAICPSDLLSCERTESYDIIRLA